MTFQFVAFARDERDGVLKGFEAPNFAPGGPSGHAFFQFGFQTSQNENGVFYVDLAARGSEDVVKLLAGAFVRKRHVHIVFHYQGQPAIPELDPGGIVETAWLIK